MENQKFTKEYFINKFEAIPAEEIGIGAIDNHCALWHCGIVDHNYLRTEESEAFVDLIGTQGRVFDINDGNDETLLGDTPKERILNALKAL